MVGPGYSPIPYKTVAQIVAGKYVNLADVLPENISHQEPEPELQLMLDGRLVFSSTPKKVKRTISDLGTWVEAFTIYALILGKYFPHRHQDVAQCKLLILRTFHQFSGRAWLHYDQEFRKWAATDKCTDWSTMNVQLYNFNTAGAQVRPRGSASASTGSESHGSNSSRIICHSWNAGACTAPTAICRFRHTCSQCDGNHRKTACTDHPKSGKADRARSMEPGDFKRRKR